MRAGLGRKLYTFVDDLYTYFLVLLELYGLGDRMTMRYLI